MAKRSMQEWFDAYGVSHQNPTNKLVHWVCVPTIYFCVTGLLWSIPVPGASDGIVAKVVVALVGIFYARLSLSIMLGMMAFSIGCLFLAAWIDRTAPWPLWAVCLTLFVLAWIGQFIGHKIEGKKPSFFEDLQFLMIGPAWLMGFIYRRLGIGY
ncbi:MAG: DUF962 domain-containing protein [Flavobacteriales bacterium]|nr:DUF962 domain-containing protein [Flavobacteriales bacterium]